MRSQMTNNARALLFFEKSRCVMHGLLGNAVASPMECAGDYYMRRVGLE